MGRYVSSNEAVWRILNFCIHDRHPTVVHLNVHLENGQRVYFPAENYLERAAEPPNTTLTAFFQLCQQDDFATPGISAVLRPVLSNDNKQVLFFMVRSFIYPSVYSCRE
jgi:hypothetical protein